MRKYDFKVRKELFQKGQIQRYKDFRSFERTFSARKRTQSRHRNVLVFVILLILLVVLLFSVKSQPIQPYPTEYPFSNVNQIL